MAIKMLAPGLIKPSKISLNSRLADKALSPIHQTRRDKNPKGVININSWLTE